MALTTSILTGSVALPTDAPPMNAELVFTLSGLDSEGGVILPPGDPARCVLINGEIPAGYSIWRNTEGFNGTHYIVSVMWTNPTRQGVIEAVRELGKIQVGDVASYVLADLLLQGAVPATNTYWSSLTAAEYQAALDAVAAAATSALASETAQIAAESAQLAAEAAEANAETARDAAFVNADVYASVAAGLAAVAIGEQFQVVSGDEVIRYREDAGPVATEVARYPNSSAIVWRAFDTRVWTTAIQDDDGYVQTGVDINGQQVSPPAPKSALARLRFQCCYVPFYGQSLSVGGSGYPPLSTEDSATDEMFVQGMRPEDDYPTGSPATWYASTVPAKEAISPRYATQGETPARGFADAFRGYLLTEDGLSASDQDFKFHLSAPGQGGIEIVKLLKGNATGYYARVIAQMQALRTLKAGVETVGMDVMPFIHGERDYLIATTGAAYKASLATLCSDIAADAKAQLGQSNDVQVLGTQVASHIANNNQINAQIALAQAEAANEIANYHLVCPMYQFPFRGPDVHLTPTGYIWLGAYIALCYKRLIVDQATWTAVKPSSYFTQGNLCEITYDLPSVDGVANGLVWDTTQVAAQPNYGFRLFNSSGVAQTIASVSISGRNRVVIEAASNITSGSYIDYARQGDATKGLGNLRDRAGDVLRAQTRYYDLPLHNWAIISKSGALV